MAGCGLAAARLFVDSDLGETFAHVAAIQVLIVCVASAVFLRTTVALWLSAMTVASLAVAQQTIGTSYADNVDWNVAAQTCSLALQILLILCLGLIVRGRLGSDTRDVFGDSLIVGLGVWLVIWVTLLQPSLNNSSETVLVNGLRGSSIALSIVVLFLLAILLFSDVMNTAAVAFICVAFIFRFSADVMRSYNARDGRTFEIKILDALFIAFLFMISAAILHPSILSIGKANPRRQLPPLLTRLVTTTISLVVPVLVLAITDSKDATDRLVRTISVVVLAISVTTRVIQSVRANAVAQTTLLHNALMDALTGLPNRTLMLEHITAALELSGVNKTQPTVLFIDIDRFKNINDSYGHTEGDNVLLRLVSLVASHVRQSDIFGRTGGDEFCLLLIETHKAEAVEIAERIRAACCDAALTAGTGVPIHFTVSVGLVESSKNDTVIGHIYSRADAAMYRAKNEGRNRVCAS